MKHNPEDHLRLVSKIAGRYNKGNRMPYEDIYQSGCIGLVIACDKYKEGDVPFGAFAGMHIEFEILKALSNSNVIKVSKETIWLASNIKKMNLIDKPVDEIAEKLNKNTKQVKKALDHLGLDVLSLEFEYHSRDEKNTILDFYQHNVEYDEDIFIEQTLDFYGISKRDKKIYKLVMEGYSFKNAIEMCGEDYKASIQRRKRHQWLWKKDKHLIFT